MTADIKAIDIKNLNDQIKQTESIILELECNLQDELKKLRELKQLLQILKGNFL